MGSRGKAAYLLTYLPTYLPTYLSTYLPTYLPTYPPYLRTYPRLTVAHSKATDLLHLSTYLPSYLQTDAVPSSVLHPGDLIRVIPNMILPCDVLLMTGQAILSEAMLTGEAAPVMKVGR